MRMPSLEVTRAAPAGSPHQHHNPNLNDQTSVDRAAPVTQHGSQARWHVIVCQLAVAAESAARLEAKAVTVRAAVALRVRMSKARKAARSGGAS